MTSKPAGMLNGIMTAADYMTAVSRLTAQYQRKFLEGHLFDENEQTNALDESKSTSPPSVKSAEKPL